MALQTLLAHGQRIEIGDPELDAETSRGGNYLLKKIDLRNAILRDDVNTMISILKNKRGEIDTKLMAHALIIASSVNRKNLIDVLMELSLTEGNIYVETFCEFIQAFQEVNKTY